MKQRGGGHLCVRGEEEEAKGAALSAGRKSISVISTSG